MAVFPPPKAVTILINGAPVAAYIQPYLARGRTLAPVRPFATALAARVWSDRGVLVLQRGSRTVRIRMLARMPDALDRAYIPIAPILRALGAQVRYDPRRRVVEVRIGSAMPVAAPTPFNPSERRLPMRAIFTPVPVATERPRWTGPAIPRRTPIPFTGPTPVPPVRPVTPPSARGGRGG
ncbi:MAG TPA: hypothetical protein VMW12_12655 [Candidatus Dormibacteraeota bacterium]|nr:hypothetical protein [Candidatus Dormibacteraeota bacterium]